MTPSEKIRQMRRELLTIENKLMIDEKTPAMFMEFIRGMRLDLEEFLRNKKLAID